MYSTTEIKISKTALLHFVMLTFVLELFKKKCYEIYFADIKDLGVGFMVVFLNQVFTWRFCHVHKLRRHCQTQKAVLTVKLHQ